jgi:oxygen-independent coproporphyrinogen-3 oxidase
MTQLTSLYLHVPFCKHLCNYCDFYKRKLESPENQFEEFHQFLKDSVTRHNTFLNEQGTSWGPLETVYLGGGTPSLWGEKGAQFFTQHILPAPLKEGAEFTMEIDPGTWTTSMLEAWKKAGLNRISVGTQSLNPEFLKVLDRVHSLKDTEDFLSYLQMNDWNFSLDFLLGVPYSEKMKRDIKQELDLLLKYSPKHISLYILNARSKYPHIMEMPEDDYIRDEYLFVSDYLKQQGFHHYEVSNFALPGFESKHNLRYWRGESVGAYGPTGTGYLNQGSQKALRYKWKVTNAEFETEELGIKELQLEKTYLTLRTSDGFPMPAGLECVVKSWTQQNYAKLTDGKIHLTSLGFLMLDSLMDDLFRWEEQRKHC